MAVMRTIPYHTIVSAVRDLCIRGSSQLPADVGAGMAAAASAEKSPLARSILKTCIENSIIAATEQVPLCQDTGFAVYFVNIGNEIFVDGGLISDAIREGTARGYREGYLRASIVNDPLFDRINTTDNTPPVIHLSNVSGNQLEIIFAPKGGGAENMSRVRMFRPTESPATIRNFVIETVIRAGSNPCPPLIVGVGIGGTFEHAALLSKRSLLRDVGAHHPDSRYAALEQEILDGINNSGIGAQGLGGTTTALAVHIETFPCHIASLPVAINLNCHVARHCSTTL